MNCFLDPSFLCFSDTQGFSIFFDPQSPKTLMAQWLCLCGFSNQPFYFFPISSKIKFPKAPSSHFDLRNHLWPSLTILFDLRNFKLYHLKSCITPHPICCIPLEFQHPLEKNWFEETLTELYLWKFWSTEPCVTPSRQSSFAHRSKVCRTSMCQ